MLALLSTTRPSVLHAALDKTWAINNEEGLLKAIEVRAMLNLGVAAVSSKQRKDTSWQLE